MIRLLLITPLALLLSACNYLLGDEGMFPNRSGDYLKAEILSAMVIPEELDSYTIDQLYVVPEQFASSVEVFEDVPMPMPIETGRRQ